MHSLTVCTGTARLSPPTHSFNLCIAYNIWQVSLPTPMCPLLCMLLLIPSQLFTLEEMQGIADIVAAHPNLTVIADEVRVCTTHMRHLLPL